MDAKRIIAGAFLLLASTRGLAIEAAPYDLRSELGEAVFVKEVRVTQARCDKFAKDSCLETEYVFDLVRQFNGTRDAVKSLREKAVLKVGSRYLFYKIARRLDPDSRPKFVSIFIPISSQPYFDGAQWRQRDWLFLPKDIDAQSFGSRKLTTRSCYADMDKTTTLKICEVASVLEYARVSSLIGGRKNEPKTAVRQPAK